MNKNTCPGCGAPWNGRRCRNCGYEPFREEPRRKSVPTGKGKKSRKKHPLLRFWILLALIALMLPICRNWGLKLEAVEEANRSVTQEPVVPAADLVTLYQSGEIHIFTTKYDTQHLSDGLTLYIRNDSDRELVFHTDALLVNNSDSQQQLYCKADTDAIGKNWLRFDPGTGVSAVRSVSFRLKAYDAEGNLLLTTDRITLGESPDAPQPDF